MLPSNLQMRHRNPAVGRRLSLQGADQEVEEVDTPCSRARSTKSAFQSTNQPASSQIQHHSHKAERSSEAVLSVAAPKVLAVELLLGSRAAREHSTTLACQQTT